jgi:UDP-3-O-[3-hydroxymyristoyl] N-acetylglucosamine deacetylase/3-hydroxyacyl-[acyl-carrier-protein] dehydratase
MLTAKRPQRTLARATEVRGVGFFHGAEVTLRFHPAEPDTGVIFERVDIPDRPSVPAQIAYAIPSQRRTTIRRGAAQVEMIEHVMAALAGTRLDNCRVEIDALECPGCDGSSRIFVEAFEQAGILEQDRPRQAMVIERSFTVREGEAILAAHQGSPDKLTLSYHLDYGPDSAIDSQSFLVDLAPDTFRSELAGSRTFLLEAEARALKQAGIGVRTTEADLLVFGPDGPINNALRYPDECVRHKILDMVGDLALAGCDLAGHVVAHRSGHQLNAELVRRLLEAVATAPPVLDVPAILKILPHRYPFLLVDRVLALEPDTGLRAIKNVSCNEPFFQGHWPGRPIMPGVLILEALAQAAGILIAQRHDPEREVALIASIDGVKLRRPVVPGDQLVLDVEALRSRPRTADVRGVARVGDQVVAEAKIRFMLKSSSALGPY